MHSVQKMDVSSRSVLRHQCAHYIAQVEYRLSGRLDIADGGKYERINRCDEVLPASVGSICVRMGF